MATKKFYPAFPLPKAVEMAAQLEAKDGFNPIPVAIAIDHLGYSPTSSTGLRAVACLLHFNLMEEDGSGDSRRVRLSELGKTIVLHPEDDSRERRKAVKEAVLSPKLYGAIWDRWGAELPSDKSLEYYLVRDFEFNRNSVRGFIRDLKESFSYAGLGGGDVHYADTAAPAESESPPPVVAPPTVATASAATAPAMPALVASDPSVQVVPIPLFDGRFATLNVPKPLSQTDYLHLRGLLNTMLDGMKGLLVTELPSEPPVAEPSSAAPSPAPAGQLPFN